MRPFQPAVSTIFLAFFAASSAIVAPSRALAQTQKPAAATGKAIGVAQFKWGMSGAQILAAPLDGVATIRALPGKGNSFQVEKLQLRPGSPNGWTLQLWTDKKGLSAFELRPTNEVYTNKIAGYPDEAIADEFQRELDLHIENVFRIKTDQWWQNSDQAQVRIKTTRAQTSMVEPPGYFVPSPSGSGPAGFVQPPSYPITRYYKRNEWQSVTLFFFIKDRAWHVERNQYRQGYLFNSKGTFRMAVVRFQGRREGKPFEPVTGSLIKTKDAGILINAIFKNYNVYPLQKR